MMNVSSKQMESKAAESDQIGFDNITMTLDDEDDAGNGDRKTSRDSSTTQSNDSILGQDKHMVQDVILRLNRAVAE